jgi:hypothetical protein
MKAGATSFLRLPGQRQPQCRQDTHDQRERHRPEPELHVVDEEAGHVEDVGDEQRAPEEEVEDRRAVVIPGER